LKKFKERLIRKRLCEYRESIKDLGEKTAIAIEKAITDCKKKEALLGWYRGDSIVKKIKETTICYYYVHLTASGTLEECLNARCRLLYHGSGLIKSPESPIIFKDTIKTAFEIKSCVYTPNITYINPDSFKRNPTSLSFLVESEKDAEFLYINGQVIINTRFEENQGGIGLYVPYFAKFVTFVVDLSRIGFLYNIKPHVSLIIKNEKGINVSCKEKVAVKYFVEEHCWIVSSVNVPPDSNIKFGWGDY
jgi:hypothetical protein